MEKHRQLILNSENNYAERSKPGLPIKFERSKYYQIQVPTENNSSWKILLESLIDTLFSTGYVPGNLVISFHGLRNLPYLITSKLLLIVYRVLQARTNGRKYRGTKEPLDAVERGEWKVGLELSIKKKKSKTMTSSPITSWQIDGEKVEAVMDFIFLGSKITADFNCSHEIKRCLLLGRTLWQT